MAQSHLSVLLTGLDNLGSVIFPVVDIQWSNGVIMFMFHSVGLHYICMWHMNKQLIPVS